MTTKSILFTFVLIIFNNTLKSQNKATLDSIFIYNQNSNFVDSLVKTKNIDFSKIYQIIHDKIQNEHHVSMFSIEKVVHDIHLKNTTQSNTCDTIKIYLIEKLINVNSSNNILECELLKLEKAYIEDTPCYFEIFEKKRIPILEKLTKLEYDIKLNNDLSLLIHRNELGRIYLFQKNYKAAEYQFSEVLGYPFYLIDNSNYTIMDKAREEYRRAGLSILDVRRGSLKKLQNTFFIPAFTGELEPIKKQYIEEMGGTYIHPKDIKD